MAASTRSSRRLPALEPRDWWLDVALIAAIALALRLALAGSAPPFLNADSEGYYLPAYDLVHGERFDLGLRRTPGYPLFIAATIALFGEDLQRLVTIQHLVFGLPTALLTYLLGRLLSGRVVALAAALLAAASGPLLLSEHYVMTEAMFTTLMLATLSTVALATRAGSSRWAALSGILFGAAILSRPSAQLLAPALVLSLFVLAPRSAPSRQERLGWRRVRQCMPLALAFAALAALVVVPWMVYNWRLHGTFAVAGNGRFLLARTLKEDPGGYSFEKPPGVEEEPIRAAARRIVQQEAARRPPGSSAQRLREELGLSDAEAYPIMFDLAVDAIRDRPLYYLQTSARFFLDILVGRPINVRREGLEWDEVDWERRARAVLQRPVHQLDAGRAQILLSLYDPARLGPVVPALFLAGTAAAALGRAPRGLLLPAATTLLLVAGSAALVGPELRYRYPQDPLIALLAVQAVAAVPRAAIVEWKTRKERM